MAAPWEDDYTQTTEVEPTPPKILGTSQKNIYGESTYRAAGFTKRMIFSNARMNDIEEQGFDPVNVIDSAKDNLPFVPEWLERMMQSTKYKLYATNKINFSTAQLRRETGAVINDSEIVWINQTYFPQLGDGPEVAALKKEARKEAIDAMELEAGGAYTGLSQEETRIEAAANAKRRAISILKRRAETNPELADKIRAILRQVRKNG
tara:strand:- start:317 stop:937 length:621 start_codon:yes stop_codon:yes gene_type:complete